MCDRGELVLEIDIRGVDAFVTFTGEVARIAASLVNLGVDDEARELLAALDRLDGADG